MKKNMATPIFKTSFQLRDIAPERIYTLLEIIGEYMSADCEHHEVVTIEATTTREDMYRVLQALSEFQQVLPALPAGKGKKRVRLAETTSIATNAEGTP